MLLRISCLVCVLLSITACFVPDLGPVGETGPVPEKSIDVTYEDIDGIWYEVARLPVAFQDGCLESELVIYRIGPDRPTRLWWDCFGDDSVASLSGVLAPIANHGFRMDFDTKSLHDWFSLKFWVLEKSERVDWLVIGHPGWERLWVLSSTPTMEMEKLEDIIHQVETAGHFSPGFLMNRLIVSDSF